ncbi:hypothetical protein E2C01_087389 [Portunus trituberculatus]|uniref:Uncharacterized protein n=1 Tax=Portunus trituberculatus TaxID=210409 RepID=A0A5B7JBQ7_PORTR|nr:hypothetical protein [Portunus trituberculatus]
MVAKSPSPPYWSWEGRQERQGREAAVVVEALGAVIGYYVGFLRRLLGSDVWWPRLSAAGYNLPGVRLKRF